jgi:hypothetical protein
MGSLIYNSTVNSNTSSFLISNLNIQKGELYEININGANPSTSNIDIYVNGNTTQSNYRRQYLYSTGGSLFAQRANTAEIMTGSGGSGNMSGYFRLTNTGHFVWQATHSLFIGGQIAFICFGGTSVFTMTSITQINLAVSVNSGSRIQIRKVGEKTHEQIVSSPTTSVTFNNLNITKDNEYLLVGEAISNLTTFSSVNIFVNGNTTTSNYSRQLLRGNATSVIANRANAPTIFELYNFVGATDWTVSKLKLTNSGHFSSQATNVLKVGTNDHYLQKLYATSQFTTDLITSIELRALNANAINTNSRFELYKLI